MVTVETHHPSRNTECFPSGIMLWSFRRVAQKIMTLQMVGVEFPDSMCTSKYLYRENGYRSICILFGLVWVWGVD
jgi:hypothetical protein